MEKEESDKKTNPAVPEEKNKDNGKEKKQEKTDRKERKPLSPEEIQKRKKMLIYPLMAMLFLLAMYLIFAPSKADKEKQQAEKGLNLDIPQVSGGDLLDDKEAAYEQANREQAEKERQSAMGALSEFFGGTQKANNRPEEWSLVAEPVYEDNGGKNQNTIRQSATAYRDIQHTLGNFYDDNSQYDKMQQQIETLQSRLDQRNAAKTEDDEMQKQLALMEKSYQMASKYMPQSSENSNTAPFTAAKERAIEIPATKSGSDEPALSVSPDVKEVVSSLYQEVSDSIFMAEQSKERNRYFHTATQTADDIPDKNTLKVAVYETVTLKDGETVRLRLLESARVANMLIPKNTLLTAMAKVQGNRLSLSVTSIEFRERIVAVKLSAYDLDGQQGIFIPNSEEMNAVKEVVAGMGQSAGTSFTFNSSAGQQLAADAGKGVMQGASQYLNKKMREIKVTLKSGHRLFLIQTK